MKIGQVVQRYGIPVNTLYFYINNGLLVPPRRNSQYVFDPHTLEELEWLLELKELEFPLKTIHRLLSLRRISSGRLTSPPPAGGWGGSSSSWSASLPPASGRGCRCPCWACCAAPTAGGS